MREWMGVTGGRRLAGGLAAALVMCGGALLTTRAGNSTPVSEQAAPAPSVSVRPSVPPDYRATLPEGVEVVQKWSLASNGKLMRIYSARRDLTGFRELRWVAEEGRREGGARCTQRIRLSAGEPVQEKPTLLLCWRTSARKSVYTVLVDTNRKPSVRESVTQLDQTWKRLS